MPIFSSGPSSRSRAIPRRRFSGIIARELGAAEAEMLLKDIQKK
jgi:hypothetical protein